VDVVVTDAEAPRALVEELRAKDIEVVLAPAGS
jgi:hypothetical protein